MAKQRIQIENLTIRLPRSAGLDAREIAGGFGREILKSVAQAANGKTGELRIDKLSAGKFRAEGGAAKNIQKRAADGVATEVRKRLG